MTVAKGQTNCEAERDIVMQGFHDLIMVASKSKELAESAIKAQLYDILTDFTIGSDEKQSLANPLENIIEEKNEIHIRIRKSILIGLYSFMELSLKNILEYYTIAYKDTGKLENLLSPLFGNKPDPSEIMQINSGLRLLRNYMTHGSLSNRMKNEIEVLIAKHPEFGLVKGTDNFYLSSYDGLSNSLYILSLAVLFSYFEYDGRQSFSMRAKG